MGGECGDPTPGATNVRARTTPEGSQTVAGGSAAHLRLGALSLLFDPGGVAEGRSAAFGASRLRRVSDPFGQCREGFRARPSRGNGLRENFGRRPSVTVAWGKRSTAPGTRRSCRRFGRRPYLPAAPRSRASCGPGDSLRGAGCARWNRRRRNGEYGLRPNEDGGASFPGAALRLPLATVKKAFGQTTPRARSNSIAALLRDSASL
jgi:hypothetical protein